MNNFLTRRFERFIASMSAKAASFAGDRRGVAFALFALAAVPIVASIGVATDVARGYLIKNRLTEALDAASLAAGRQPDPALRQSDAERFFWANFGENYLGTTVTAGPTVVSDPDTGTVTVTAEAQIPTTFMNAVGIGSVDVGAKSVVTRQLGGIELMLVIDNTGSMGSNGRIEAAQQAAKDLLAIIYGTEQSLDDVWVGLVPYVTVVNVGSQHTSWLEPSFDLNDYIPPDPRGWTGCVVARAGNADRTDDPPSVDPIIPFYWESDTWSDWIPGWGYPTEHNDNYNVWGPAVIGDGASGRDERGPNRGCVMAMSPLTPYRDRLEDRIDLMEPRSYGGTMINVGLVWGWRALSPRWRGLWGGDTPADLPLDYDEPNMQKAIILLTDGENMMGYNEMTAYRELQDGMLGTTWQSAAENELDSRTAETCAAVKAAGIRLYTITFQQNDPGVQTLMRNCASAPHEDHYYDSPTNETLRQAFKDIAGKLSKLRISE